MKRYAGQIGADYLFELNPRFVTNLGRYSPHYGSFKPVYDKSFYKYDNVLYTDTDVFAVEGLKENIFDKGDKSERLEFCLILSTVNAVIPARLEISVILFFFKFNVVIDIKPDSSERLDNSELHSQPGNA